MEGTEADKGKNNDIEQEKEELKERKQNKRTYEDEKEEYDIEQEGEEWMEQKQQKRKD